MSQRVPPATRREFIKFLTQRGWIGPLPGGNHEYMVRESHRQAIPSQTEIAGPFLLRLLKQAGYTRDDWLSR